MHRTYDVLAEPRGTTYDALIDAATGVCTAFQLVVRSEMLLGEGATKLLGKLQLYQQRAPVRGSKWPGTELIGTESFGHEATLHRFRLCPDSTTILKAAVRGLYEWVQPDRPEDLCLLTSENRPWLATIAHERDAFLCLSDEEAEAIRREVPGLTLRLTNESCGDDEASG